jgi:hypothetical protein
MAVVARQQVQRLEHGLEQLKQALAALRPGPGMESRAAVSETLAYLHGEALPALERGELPAILGSEIEAAVRALAEAQAQLLQQHKELNQLTRGLRCEGEFDPDEFFKLLNEHIKKIDAARKQYVLLVKARLLGWQFLALFPRDAQVLQSLQASISEAAAAPDMALDYQPLLDTLVNRLDGLDETLSDDRTLGHRKEGMKVFTRNAFENTRQELAEVNQALEKATLAGAELQKNLRLAVKLEKGKMEMFELREVAAVVAVAVAAQPVGEAAAVAA